MINFIEDSDPGYRHRTYINAGADFTLAIAADFTTAGEKLTESCVRDQHKLLHQVNISSGLDLNVNMIEKIVTKLNRISHLTNVKMNIAGNGIYTLNRRGFSYSQQQLDHFVFLFLKAILNHPDLKTQIIEVVTGGQTGIDEAGAKAADKLGYKTSIVAPKGWRFRGLNGDIIDEQLFKNRFS